MLGGAINKKPTVNAPIVVHHTAEVTCVTKGGTAGVVPKPIDPITKIEMTPTATAGHPIRLINLTTGTRTQITSGSIDGTKAITFKNPRLIESVGNTADTVTGDKIRIFWEEVLDGVDDTETAVEVTISPNTFPGQYRVVGDTFMRSQATGKDEPFQFVINNAKVQSNVTITLEAEGDPSTFDLTLTVLRSGSDEMMKLVRYSVSDTGSGTSENDNSSIKGST